MTKETRIGPLVGLKVLEIGHYVAGPFCTRLLADLGADVVKIEPPGGDPIRGWGAAVDGHAVWFSVHGRNKKSVVLDLKKDRATVLALAAKADVLVENMRAGQLERLMLGPDVLHEANPRLVIARVSGYGQDGPYRDKPAFGAIGEAIGGLRHLTGHPSGSSDLPPPRCGISISDDLAGMYAAIGLLAALWQRDAGGAAPGGDADGGSARGGTGRGRVVDVNLVDSVVSLMEGMLPEYAMDGRIRQPQGAAIETASPTNTYPCADGKWLCIAGNSDLIFRRLMPAIGRPELAEAPEYATNGLRCANRAALDEAIAAWTRTQAAKDAEAILEAAEVPCSRLFDIADIAADPHMRARAAVQEINDPLIGPTLHPGPVIRLDGDPPERVVAWTGPAVGVHTAEVLDQWLGTTEKHA
jgi:crotonobetainyl-CoA:carnitine CoA-transferase CaiB-like acyl-CoA transferase